MAFRLFPETGKRERGRSNLYLEAAATVGMPEILCCVGYSGGVGDPLCVRVGDVAGEMEGDNILTEEEHRIC